MYIHAADIWVPFGKPEIIGTNEEALYVIDALCHHESDLHIREHYTDTGGSTEHVFALASLLGFRFAPRISDALSKKLYLLDAVGASAPLDTLLFDQVNKKLITQQWDEMRRGASSYTLARVGDDEGNASGPSHHLKIRSVVTRNAPGQPVPH